MPRKPVVQRTCKCIDFSVVVVNTEEKTITEETVRLLDNEIGRKTDIVKYINSTLPSNKKVVEVKGNRKFKCVCVATEKDYFKISKIVKEVE